MMTEAEAKTKWCPHVRYLATFRSDDGKLETAGCFNRGGADSGLEKSRCIASECMAWQFKDRQYSRDTELWSRSKNQRVNSGWHDDTYWKPVGEKADKEPPPAIGFCGAFGRPK